MDDTSARVSSGRVEGRLTGKVALVTGAGSGQGRAVATLFAAAGATVLGSDINTGSLEETRALAREQGLTIETMSVDASSPDDVGRWVTNAVDKHGVIDVLYNNGAGTHFAPFEEMTIEQWHETIRLELDVVFVPTQAVWPHMTARGGSIINIASVSGMAATEGLGASAHAAGKGGVIGWTRQVAIEGAKHWIRVNSISPGPILTPASEPYYKSDASFRQWFDGQTMLPRTGRPIDIAYAGLFLASDESSFVTGSNLVVDGGTSSKLGMMMRGISA